MPAPKKGAPQPLDPNPILMSVLLNAKGALLQAQTMEAFSVIKQIQELEVGLPAKTVLGATAINAAKALSTKIDAGAQIDLQDVTEVTSKFRLL